MRTIIWFIYFWFYLLGLYPWQKYYEKRKAAGLEYISGVDRIVQNWAKRLLMVAGVSAEVSGLENIPRDRAVLFTSNHQGNFDIPLMLTSLDQTHPLVAKDSLAKIPFLSSWMRLFDCLFLDRTNARQSLKVFAEAEALIKEGKSVIIFPEGTRSRKDEAGEFKEGAYKIALRTGAAVVPVAIDGSYRAMEANKGIWIRPTKVKITILPPVETADLTKEESKHLGAHIREQIMACNGR
ncbi:1-acyl-sn-glycerol-3-phosphate acyltransferase [Aminipila butyrica]|uniref:1-acyl-sn-glycerol-3-phosphate acyltransferase n=1 Tax=Aminipila butyrica TaxID=433296 RepID=A0A858BRC2_9FIRM|nr:lysophospholipid acyltransferase family protein [Aminipila butyrica]QIB68461.1 1-acyl-sn-glycerol-3-phosphate acyltransferase [Aminipila butyrica]